MRIVHRRKTDTPSGPRELDRHLPFQRREWRAQQIGWIALGLFLAAALAGLFGGGPLSSARASDPGGGLTVDYQRFVRAGASCYTTPDEVERLIEGVREIAKAG